MKEDLAAFFLKQGTISESQERYLAGCKFYREDLFSDDDTSSFTDAVSSESTDGIPVESTGIMICSVPNDAMEEDECYQTPPEQHTSEPAEQVGETPVSVDLAKDTDLVFSDGKTLSGNNIGSLIVSDSQESHDLGVKSVKNRIFKGKSALLKGLSTPELKKLDLDMNDGLNDGLDSQIGNDSEYVEVVQATCEDVSGNQTMELDNPEANHSISPEPAPAPAPALVSESRKLPDWVDKLVVEQEGKSRASPKVGDKCAERGHGKGVKLGGRGGLAEGEMSGINGNSSTRGGVAEAANVEVPEKAFVTLDDLMGPLEDDDILVAAIKAGWKFPRPRSWGPEGSQSKVVHKS